MKAIQIKAPGGPEVLELVELPDPKPQPTEAVVKLGASGVNFIDVYQREGRYKVPLPFIAGQEGSGTVTAVGAEVKSVKQDVRAVHVVVEDHELVLVLRLRIGVAEPHREVGRGQRNPVEATGAVEQRGVAGRPDRGHDLGDPAGDLRLHRTGRTLQRADHSGNARARRLELADHLLSPARPAASRIAVMSWLT